MLLPIRHHSPACARIVRDAVLRLRPAAVLIEGPTEFNDRLEELYLGHRLPLAIYSYVAWENGMRQGAYYPFCEYSPEWQALIAAREIKAVVRFIDLPYAMLSREKEPSHRYADGRLSSSDYVKELINALQVDNFNEAWDLIAEQANGLSHEAALQRIAEYCKNLRQMDELHHHVSESDKTRECFMAQHIRAAWQEFGRDRVIVVTGGYHTSGLDALLAITESMTTKPEIPWPAGITERGIALTPYSYQRLDALKGYEAGMPSPGFYEAAWRADGRDFSADLLQQVAARLRHLKQSVSTADLIAVKTTAAALAALRGHPCIWRRDLIHAVTAALLKDDVHDGHPFLQELYTVLRGTAVGQLAPGSPQPPLVIDIQAKLAKLGFSPESETKIVTLNLTKPDQLSVSRILQQLRVLRIPGFVRPTGVDFALRDDLSQLSEFWEVQWKAGQDAAMIEASRYGSALEEAAAAALAEAASNLECNAASAALLLLDAVLAGIFKIAVKLAITLKDILHADGDLASVSRALEHLHYLYSWDDVLGSRDSAEAGDLLAEAFHRALWLLEYGNAAATAKAEVYGIKCLFDALQSADKSLPLNRGYFIEVLQRVQMDETRPPAQRGACAGALWSLQSANPEEIRRNLKLFGDSEKLGDYLTGVFTLARETAQHDQQFLAAIHSVVSCWSDEEFYHALPALRLAFMNFTAREKFYMAKNLFPQTAGGEESEPVPLELSISEAAEALAFEVNVMAMAKLYGITLQPSL